jgi:hypothetical protein
MPSRHLKLVSEDSLEPEEPLQPWVWVNLGPGNPETTDSKEDVFCRFPLDAPARELGSQLVKELGSFAEHSRVELFVGGWVECEVLPSPRLWTFEIRGTFAMIANNEASAQKIAQKLLSENHVYGLEKVLSVSLLSSSVSE